MEMVIGSLSAIVAVAVDAPDFNDTCAEGSVVVIVPSVTVNGSAVSDSSVVRRSDRDALRSTRCTVAAIKGDCARCAP